VARQGVELHERGLSEAETVYRMAGGTDEYLQQLAAEAPDGDRDHATVDKRHCTRTIVQILLST
jgi:hypothetical protein